MEYEEIAERILKECIDIDLNKIENWKEKSFFGKEINLAPRSLVIYFISLEEYFKIKFSEESVNKKRLLNFRNVLELLQEQF